MGSTMAVKSGQLGCNVGTFMPIFLADTLDFLVANIFLEEGIYFFFGNLSTGTDLAINFDLVKCVTKNKYSYLNYNGKLEGGLSPEGKI